MLIGSARLVTPQMEWNTFVVSIFFSTDARNIYPQTLKVLFQRIWGNFKSSIYGCYFNKVASLRNEISLISLSVSQNIKNVYFFKKHWEGHSIFAWYCWPVFKKVISVDFILESFKVTAIRDRDSWHH